MKTSANAWGWDKRLNEMFEQLSARFGSSFDAEARTLRCSLELLLLNAVTNGSWAQERITPLDVMEQFVALGHERRFSWTRMRVGLTAALLLNTSTDAATERLTGLPVALEFAYRDSEISSVLDLIESRPNPDDSVLSEVFQEACRQASTQHITQIQALCYPPDGCATITPKLRVV